MIIAGHQPEYLPYPGFFYKMMVSDKFVIVDNIQYEKKNWQNRNRIRTPDGWSWLNVPVITHGRREQLIKDVEINNETPWRQKTWQSIETSYRNAPYFEKFGPAFKKIFDQEWNKLIDLNIAIIKTIMNILQINKNIELTSSKKVSGQKTELLINICKEYGANTYLSGSGAEYVDEQLFEKTGFKHKVLKFNSPVYKQQFTEFEENLSILDMIFNLGENAKEIILKANEENTQSIIS
jgi:hypothetical protein